MAAALTEGFDRIEAVIADRGYDADSLVTALQANGIEAVIPPRSHRRSQRSYNKTAYKLRNIIERTFCKLKGCRRIATRYCKTDLSFLSLLHLKAALLNSNTGVNTP